MENSLSPWLSNLDINQTKIISAEICNLKRNDCIIISTEINQTNIKEEIISYDTLRTNLINSKNYNSNSNLHKILSLTVAINIFGSSFQGFSNGSYSSYISKRPISELIYLLESVVKLKESSKAVFKVSLEKQLHHACIRSFNELLNHSNELALDELSKLSDLITRIMNDFIKIIDETSFNLCIKMFLTLLDENIRFLFGSENESKDFEILITAIKLLDSSLNINYTKNPIITQDKQIITFTQAYRYGAGADGIEYTYIYNLIREASKITGLIPNGSFYYESITLPSFSQPSLYEFSYKLPFTNNPENQGKTVKFKIIKNVLYDLYYNTYFKEIENTVELKHIELILQVNVAPFNNSTDMYMKSVNISVPFTDLQYDIKIEDSPLEVYRCISFRNYMPLNEVYKEYMNVELNKSHEIKYWSTKNCQTINNSTHLKCICKDASIIGIKRDLKSTFFLRIFLINVVFILVVCISYFLACLVHSSYNKFKTPSLNLWKKLLKHDITTVKGCFKLYLKTMHSFTCGVKTPLISTMIETTLIVFHIISSFPVIVYMIDAISSVDKMGDRKSTYWDLRTRFDIVSRCIFISIIFLLYYETLKSCFIKYPQRQNRVKLVDSHFPTNENLRTEENKDVKEKSHNDKSDIELRQIPEILNKSDLNNISKFKEGTGGSPDVDSKRLEELKTQTNPSISPKSFTSVHTEVHESNQKKIITHRFNISIDQQEIDEVYGFKKCRLLFGIIILILGNCVPYYFLIRDLKYISVYVMLSGILHLSIVQVLLIFVFQPLFFLLMAALVLIKRRTRFAFLRILITNEAGIIYSKVKNIKNFIEQEKQRYIKEIETQTQEK